MYVFIKGSASILQLGSFCEDRLVLRRCFTTYDVSTVINRDRPAFTSCTQTGKNTNRLTCLAM